MAYPGPNLELQQALNPPGELRVEHFGWTYAIGDKVMQTENAYDKDVYNGDLGFIRRIDPDAAEVAIDFEGRGVAHDGGKLDEVVPAYATTVPKAQGSEYPAVAVPLVTQHNAMLRRNLVYHRRDPEQAAGRNRRPAESGDGRG